MSLNVWPVRFFTFTESPGMMVADDLSLNLHILRSFYFWAWVHYYHSQVILSRYNLFYTKSIQYLTWGWLFLSFSVFCKLKCFKFCLSQRIIKALDIKNKSALVEITKYQANTAKFQNFQKVKVQWLEAKLTYRQRQN